MQIVTEDERRRRIRAHNPDAYDERGLLKDGRSIRVPIMLMDGVQKAVAE